MSFFAELRRRNVIRVGIAYTLVAWVIAQVAEFSFETFAAPDWVLKSVVVVLLLGLPLVLFFAWAFEITPEGIKREKDVDRSVSITAQTGRKLDRTIVFGLVFVGLLVVARPWLPGGMPVTTDTPTIGEQAENSVAVLPFTDLSPEGGQDYFSDGISEEILNALVRIPGLKVAGRTSSFSYKGKNEDLRNISAALGVNHVLEGSVRRSGDRLRITAQLIRGEDGFHLWSEAYDRELADIFTIQDEIARSVAKQLALSLGLADAVLVTDRTDNIVAYQNYLRARDLHRARGKENMDVALLLLQEAVALDPGFAPAWAEIAGVYSDYEAYQDAALREDSKLQWRATGEAAARRAIALNPDDSVAHGYLGVFLAFKNQWIESFRSFDRAVELAPNDPAILDAYAQQLTEVGYFDEMLDKSQRAVTLDPLVAIYRNSLARAFRQLDDLESSIREFKKAISLDPLLVFPYSNLVRIFVLEGRWDEASMFVEKAGEEGAWEPKMVALVGEFVSAEDDEEAMRAVMDKYGQDPIAATLIGDLELATKLLIDRWNRENQAERQLFGMGMDFVYRDPRWKAQIRRYGILDLWRERGFPDWCRPLGSDDFECVSE